MLTKESLAERLNGREYCGEITDAEALGAKAAGLVVVFGGSDDLMEFRGAIYDELGANGGVEALVDAKGLLPEREQINDDAALEDFFARRKTARKITAEWCKDDTHSWTYSTDIPHATFEILEDGAPYCRGIVFALADLLTATRPKIICLCGSTKFIEMFAVKQWELELEGHIVLGCTLLPKWYCPVRDHFAESLGVKEQRDNHHLQKIDLADEVLVLNCGGYIGESTRNEIAYAESNGKPVRYLETPAPSPPETLTAGQGPGTN